MIKKVLFLFAVSFALLFTMSIASAHTPYYDNYYYKPYYSYNTPSYIDTHYYQPNYHTMRYFDHYSMPNHYTAQGYGRAYAYVSYVAFDDGFYSYKYVNNYPARQLGYRYSYPQAYYGP